LSSALVKITGDIGRIPTRDLRTAGAMNAFFFAPAIKGDSISALVATHPPLQQRLDQLAKVAAELGRPI
jgi:heat shock protein HtpX